MDTHTSSPLVAVGLWSVETGPPCPLPLFLSRVRAGFPSPADDYVERQLDLHDYLIQRPASTFFVRVEGDSMTEAGIHSGDLLVVDRAIEATDGSIVVAALDGDLTVKRLVLEGARAYLAPEHPGRDRIEITGGRELVIWGVVLHVIHTVQ